MKKAFIINGGAGRVLCSIPALEKYAEKHDDFIIVSQGWKECFYGSPKLRDKVYDVMHKGLFEEHLRDKEIITPEPYHLNAYFNQKCNLIQAFDMIINELDEIPPVSKINIELSKKEQVDGYELVNEVRAVKKKEKVIVFQPYGSGVTQTTNFIYDQSGRSFEMSDIYKLIEELNKDYGLIVMSQIPIPSETDLGVAWPQGGDIRTWMGIINAADYFLGCDSLGQHIAYALNKPATVVIGSTFPQNITYEDHENFHIVDNGGADRVYTPYRITMDDHAERKNEALMLLKDESRKEILDTIRKKLGTSKTDLKSKL